MVDRIAHAELGAAELAVAIWEANPGLADQPPRLPAGLVIRLPDVTVADQPAQVPVRLWGRS